MHKLDVTGTSPLRTVIKKETFGHPEQRFLHRLHCLVLLGRGFSCYQVAEWFGDHPRTVERWAHNFDESGVAGLRDRYRRGRPGKVDDEHLNQLIGAIAKTPAELWLRQGEMEW